MKTQQIPIKTTPFQKQIWGVRAALEGRTLSEWVRYHCNLAALSTPAREHLLAGKPLATSDYVEEYIYLGFL